MRQVKPYNTIFPALLLSLFLCLLTGCSKGELHGELEGNWEIMQVTAPDGQDMEVIPQRYYAIMRNVIQLRIYGSYITTGALSYQEPYLTLDFPYEEKENAHYPLKEWWILSNPVRMKVEKLNGKTLELSTEGYIIRCRRF